MKNDDKPGTVTPAENERRAGAIKRDWGPLDQFASVVSWIANAQALDRIRAELGAENYERAHGVTELQTNPETGKVEPVARTRTWETSSACRRCFTRWRR